MTELINDRRKNKVEVMAEWTNEFLDGMRVTGDPLADAAAEVLWNNRDRPIIDDLRMISANHHLKVRKNVDELRRNIDLSPEEVAVIETYFNESEKISETMTDKDKECFKLNAELFQKYGYIITSLLFFKSLPSGYMCPKPGFVLHTTKMLESFAARRVLETAQFVFAVNTEDWFEPGSDGLEAIQKVRLMHAGMRMALLQDERPGKEWNMELGIPINQEDVALTNHLFSLAMIEGLDEFGIHLLEEEREAIFHTWQWIGRAMGICDALYVTDYKSGEDQFHTIFERQISTENMAGPPLTSALLSSMNEITHEDISMNLLEDFTMYLLNDARSWESLGLHKPSTFDRFMNWLIHSILSLKVWQRLFHHKKTGFFHRLFRKIGNFILIKKFHLGKYMLLHPDCTPLEAFTKVILNELRKRDMKNFIKSSPEDRQKDFFIDDKLYIAWDLGSFNMKFRPRQ